MDPLAANGSGGLEGSVTAQKKQVWIQEQSSLKQRLVCTDDFSWRIPDRFGDASGSCRRPRGVEEEQTEGESLHDGTLTEETKGDFPVEVPEESKETDSLIGGTDPSQEQKVEREKEAEGEFLKYVGGMDLSFIKENETIACSALVVLDVQTMKTVYEDFELVTLEMPYIPGFLAFRESPALLNLLNKLKSSPTDSEKYPQLLLIDGNGILHPRGFGLASHIGVVADIPTLGIGKTLFEVDGLNERSIKEEARRTLLKGGESMNLVGKSGTVWGAALKSTQDCYNPVFVSIGHRISLQTGLEIVKRCCQFRIPEPVRLADKKSRQYLRVHGYGT